jgi:CRISPR-associated protein Cas1
LTQEVSCLSCLYGITEAAVLAAGYAPAISFLHTDKPLSFVYDIADLFKLGTVLPSAFRIAARAGKGRLDLPLKSAMRRECRDGFRTSRLLDRIIPTIEEVLEAGEVARPEPPPDAQPVAFEDPEPSGDAGHRG